MEIESAPSAAGGVLKKEIDVQLLKFKPHVIEATTTTYKELFDESYCEACFGFHDLANNRSVPIAERGLEMMICYGCQTHVHRYCYGYKTLTNEVMIQKEEKSRDKMKISMFVCDKCKHLEPKTKKANQGCKVCHQSHGAMKKVAGNEFVHIICALFSDAYEVVDFQNMTISKSQSEPEDDDDDAICEYCQKGGGLFKCETCDERTHIYCAFAERVSSLLQDEDSKKGWRITFDESSASKERAVNLCSAKTPKFSQKIRAHEEKKNALLDSSSQIMGLDSLKHEEERYKQIWENLDKDLKKDIPGFPLVKYSKKTVLRMQCQEHRDPEVFCYCQRPYNTKQKNFGCESCSNWYHCVCAGVDTAEIQKITQYFCKQCRDWFSFRKSAFAGGKSSPLTLIDTIDRTGIIMKSRMKFKTLDFVITSLILQRKLFDSLKKGQNYEETLENLKDTAQYIPFNLDGLFGKVLAMYKLQQLNKKIKAEENGDANMIKQFLEEKIKELEAEKDDILLLVEQEQEEELTLEKALTRLDSIEALCTKVVIGSRPNLEEVEKMIQESNSRLLQKEYDEVKKIQENWEWEKDHQQELVETAIFGFPEAQKFVESLKNLKTIELKLEWYAYFEEYLVQNHSPNKTEPQCLVRFTEEELKSLLRDGKRGQQAESENYKKVANALKFIQNFKREATQSVEKAIDIPTLKKLHHQAEKFENGFTEADEIRSKYSKFNKIKEILKDTKSFKFSQLEERFEEFQNNFIDERWKLSFTQKLQNANQVKFHIKKFFDQEAFGDMKKLDEILMKVERCCVHLEEKEDLISVQKSFQWLKRLEVFLKKSLEDAMETEEQNQSVEKMCEFCNQTSILNDGPLETLVNYKALIDEGKEITHFDKRIKEVFDFHEKMCWHLRASCSPLDARDLKQLHKEGLEINGIEHSDIRKIESIMTEYANWVDKYNNLIESENFENMFEQTESVKTSLLHLEEEYQGLGVRAQVEYRVIKSALSWMIWSEKASNLLEMVNSKKKISLEGLEDLVSFGVLIKIPDSFHLSKKVTEQYNKLRDLQTSFQNIIKRCQETKTRREKAQKIRSEEVRNTELDKLYDSSPFLQKAFEIQKRVAESSLSVSEEDLEELRRNIKACQAWGDRVKFFLELHTKDGGRVTDSKKIQEVNHGLKSIRNEMTNSLCLRDTKWEKELFRYYWQLNVNSITNKLSSKIFSYSYESWKTLYNAAQKSGNEGILNSDLYKEIESQVVKFGLLIEKIHKVQYDDEILQQIHYDKEEDSLISRQELIQLKTGLEGCKINIKKEKEYLDGLIEKLMEIIGPYLSLETTLGKLKVPTKKYGEVWRQLLELPIQVEIEPFDVSWQKSKEIESLLEEVNNRGSTLVPFELAEKIYLQYRDCCIRIPEAQKISKLYSENIAVFRSLEGISGKNELVFEDIQDLNRKADHLKLNFGEKLEEITTSLWVSKVDLIRQFKEATGALPQHPIRLSILRECLFEGYNYMKTRESIRKLRSSVQFMEQLLTEVNEKLNNNPDQMEEEDFILFNFIDVREDILNPLETSGEDLIRDFGTKDEDEILEMKDTLVLDQGKKIARKAQPKSSLLNKRSSTFEPIDDFSFPSKEAATKAVKRESTQVIKISSSLEDEENGGQVDEAMRLESKKKLLHHLKEIPDFAKIDKPKKLVIDLENHSFQKFHHRGELYEKRIKGISGVFEKLKKCKHLVVKLVKSQFDVKEVLTLMREGVEEQEKVAQEEALSNKKARLFEDSSIIDSLVEAKGITDSPFSAKHLQAKKATPPHAETILTLKKKSMEEEKETVVASEDIRRVFHGKIRFEKRNFESFRCSVYTCEKNDFITKFPKFDENIEFQGRLKLKEGLGFLKNLLGKAERKVFFGWIHVQDESQEGALQNLVDNLRADEKIGSIKCNSQLDLMMYLIPATSVPEDLKSQAGWHSRNETALCAIYYRKELPENFECIKPQVIKKISTKAKKMESLESNEPAEDQEITSSLSIKKLSKHKIAHLLREAHQGHATPERSKTLLSQQSSLGNSSQKKSKDQSPHQSKKEKSRLFYSQQL